jgi:hypothetical protein
MNILREFIEQDLKNEKLNLDIDEVFEVFVKSLVEPLRFRPKSKGEEKDKFGTLIGAKKVPYTPLSLIKDMSSKIDMSNKGMSICVCYTLEAVLYFLFKGFTNITLVSLEYDKKLEKSATKFGFIYKTLEQLREEKMKFDLVIGNPPYQGEKRGGGQGSGNAIWQDFVEKSFEITKDDGFIVLVHPIDWRTGLRKKMLNAQSLMFSKQIIFLKMHFLFPGAGIVCDWYVIQNTKKTKPTTCEFLDGVNEILIPDEIQHIKAYSSEEIKTICKKVLTESDNGFYARKMMGGLKKIDNTSPNGSYPFVRGKKRYVNNPLFEEKAHIHQFEKKVIFSDTRKFEAFYDDGKLGIGDHIHYILVKSESEGIFLVNFCNSKLCSFFQGIFSNGIWSTEQWDKWNSPAPLKQLKIHAAEFIKSDYDFYQFYGLTSDEINFVEQFLKDHSKYD